MSEGLWASWYDLPQGDAQRILDWTHQSYLPFLNTLPGIRWVAHYRYAGGGAQMSQVKQTVVSHTEDEDIGHGSQYLVLAGAANAHAFFVPEFTEAPMPEGFGQMLAWRQGLRSAAFTLEAGVDGPSRSVQTGDSAPAPAIQMGTLQPRSIESEFDLIRWYAQYRLPSMAKMAGVVRTRKWSGVAGWPKHGILYEFESLAHRLEHFERPHESLALDPTHWTNKITRASVHAPGSPFIGERIWPPA
ncbi:hypothetical protein WG922_05270 [Ramlibacter sp. AN1015]|uniref:hypothetical protein n=1 Tax=Ramlibacter sp. AN1015 TaxID=3133428 RepID=UPI0030C29AA5